MDLQVSVVVNVVRLTAIRALNTVYGDLLYRMIYGYK